LSSNSTRKHRHMNPPTDNQKNKTNINNINNITLLNIHPLFSNPIPCEQTQRIGLPIDNLK
jgi:hypothetical protein